MILSSGRRFVFVHIPKTGGTSLALALEARAMRDDLMLGDTPKAVKRRKRVQNLKANGRLWKHSTLADIDGLVSDDVFKGLFAFTLVRNPWDRAVSYYHWLRAQSFDHPAVALAGKTSFCEFVTHPHTHSSFRAYPARSYMLRADGVEQCDAYIRIEKFGRDARPLFDHLGFELSLPTVNTSERDGDFRSYYNDEAAEAIAGSCTEDIKRFGYQFDGPGNTAAEFAR